MEIFTYQTLEDSSLNFRLFILKPLENASTPAIPLHGEMIHIKLEDEEKPQYETVSYFWGNPARCSLIIVDEKALRVPENTERTLRKLANTDRQRVLWIDAVCINQDDVEERSCQVAIMSIIYESSTGNMIDLGDADSMDSRAIENIDAIFEEICEATGDLKNVVETIIQNGSWGRSESSLGTPVDVEALIQFFSRPWFRCAQIYEHVPCLQLMSIRVDESGLCKKL